jgi:hypothetical protein
MDSVVRSWWPIIVSLSGLLCLGAVGLDRVGALDSAVEKHSADIRQLDNQAARNESDHEHIKNQLDRLIRAVERMERR